MSCQCSFNLYTNGLSTLYPTSSINKEKYTMPCADAVNFLRTIDPRGRHLVSYVTQDVRNNTYTSSKGDPSLTAAAKIELFMKNPAYMPESSQYVNYPRGRSEPDPECLYGE